jgi:hypothetical protein
MPTSTLGGATQYVLPLIDAGRSARHRAASSWRDELRDAAERQGSEAVPGKSWQLLVEALELTAMAACAELESDEADAALLASCASACTQRARVAMGNEPAIPVPLHTSVPRHTSTDAGSLHRVRRTSARLAGVLLGATPADPDMVRRALHTHEVALDAWRLELIARRRRNQVLWAS